MAAREATRTFAPLPHRYPLDELLSLYGCCDVFLSLHRSEGFGRGIAEALPLGVDVIATAYAGNTDFCADGHVWGEPYLEHAAELMQRVAARRLTLAADPKAAAPAAGA